ncbi:MAG: HEAT repeat domain-containing protein [Planctomycetota bacterium]|jgi:hypothetical protein
MRRYLLIVLLCAPTLAEDARDETADLARRLGASDPDTKIEAARAAAQRQDASLTAPLIKLLKDKNPAVRVAAVEALGLRQTTSERKRAAKALSARIRPLQTKEEDTDELLKVVQSLHDLAQPVALRPLTDIPAQTDVAVARARLRAAANIPSKEAIERIIQFGSSGRRGRGWRRKVATDALRYATQEQVRGGVEDWRRWWSDNKRTFDVDFAANKRAEQRAKEEERKQKRAERKRKKKKDKEGP